MAIDKVTTIYERKLSRDKWREQQTERKDRERAENRGEGKDRGT